MTYTLLRTSRTTPTNSRHHDRARSAAERRHTPAAVGEPNLGLLCAHRVCRKSVATFFTVLCTDLSSNVSKPTDSEEIVWPRVRLQIQSHPEVAHASVQVSKFQQNAHTRASGSARLHLSLFFLRCLSPPLDWPRSVGFLLAHDRSCGLVRAGQVAHCRQVEAQCVFEAPHLPRRDTEK